MEKLELMDGFQRERPGRIPGRARGDRRASGETGAGDMRVEVKLSATLAQILRKFTRNSGADFEPTRPWMAPCISPGGPAPRAAPRARIERGRSGGKEEG